MKQWFLGLGVAMAILTFSACGGGGGGGGGGSNGGGSGPPPTAPPTPSVAMYSGSETISNVYTGYPCGAPCGDPSVTPYPNNNVTYGLSDSVSSTSGGTVTATDTVTEPTEKLTSSLTTYVSPSPSAGVTDYGVTQSNYSDSDGYTQTITYPTPPGLIVDQEPENNNATWTNTAQRRTAETYSDGTDINRTTNADGSYLETEVDSAANINDTATVNSNASGSWEAASGSYGFLGGAFTGYTFTAPSGGDITFTATEASTSTPPPTETLTVSQWFSTSPLVLASNTSKITTNVTFPGSCDVPATYGTTGNDVHTVVTSLDPLFGFTETTTTDAYTTTASGLVCVQSTDVLDTYYDWNLDEHYFLYASSTALIATTTTTTLTLQSGGGVGITSSLRGDATALSPAAVAQALVSGEHTRLRSVAEKRVLSTITAHGLRGLRP